jgi:PAS domain S-box-containing protein
MSVSPKLRHLLSGLFGLLALISLVAIGWHVAAARQRLAEAEWIGEANRLGDLILRATASSGMERGLTIVLLGSRANGIRAGELARLALLPPVDAPRRDLIQAQLLRLARIAAPGKLQDAIARLEQARQQLATARTRADDCLDARSCIINTTQWVEAINGQIDALANLRRLALRPLGEQMQTFAENPLIKEIVYTMTEYAGRERALVGSVLAEQRPFTPKELAVVHGYRGVVGEALQKIDLLIAQMPADEATSAARAALRSEYQERFEVLRQRVFAASARGTAYPVGAVDWFEAATRAMETMMALAERLDMHALNDIRQVRQQAQREVGLYTLTGMLVILILLLAVRVFRRRALRPLRRLELAALTIGAGDLGQPLTGFYRDELGEVATAFESMRGNLLLQMERLEQARAEAEPLRRVVEQTDDLVIISTPTGIIEYVNAAFEKVTGYGRDEVIGEHTRLLKSGRHDTTFYREMWRTISAGESFQARMIDRRKDGGLYHSEKTITPLRDEHGAITHYVCTAKDVTERHRLDEQLRQSEKLASIGQLAAGVAHEINNPVGFVHSNLGSLARYFEKLLRVLEHYENRRELIAGTGEAGRAWAAEVEALKAEADYAYLKEDIPALLAESRDGLTRVRHIVQDLRDFSRADAREIWELADLRAGLDSTLNIVHNEIKYRADVVKHYAPLPLVECMLPQLNQVFMNLIVNAAQAIPEDRRGMIELRCGQRDDTVWVEVADDGEGIPEENLKKIFDPFYTTKPVGKGTGLGLALSYGIVEKHGGRIQVESQPSFGTTFRIVLPITRQTADRGDAEPPAAVVTVPPAPTFSR